MINLLVEVSPVDANGSTVVLRLASANATRAGLQFGDGYRWLPLITKQPTRDVSWSSEGEVQETSISWEPVVFNMAAAFDNDEWPNLYNFQGAPCRIWRGNMGDPFSSYTKIYEGTAGAVSRKGLSGELPLLGTDFALDRYILTTTYSGTDPAGGMEGQAGLRGILKPFAAGTCLNVEPIKVDPINLIFQYHGYGATKAVDAVYENALTLGDPIANVATIAALKALDLKEGQWAAAPAFGAFRLGSEPSGKITADVRGALASDGTFPTTVGGVMKLIIQRAGQSASMIAPSLAGRTETWSLYLTDQSTVQAELRSALLACGCASVPTANGQFAAVDYYTLSVGLTLNANQSEGPIIRDYSQLAVAPPVYRVVVSGERCWSVHSEQEISQAVATISADAEAAAAQAELARQEAAQAQADADVQKKRIDDILADGLLTRDEKAQQIARYDSESVQFNELYPRASAFNVSTERAALNAAWNALNTYLNGLLPGFRNLDQPTPIDATYDTKWRDYELSKIVLLRAMSGAAATTASWGGVAGKPNTLGELDTSAGTKLAGIEEKATAGAIIGGPNANVRNPDGSLYIPITSDYEDIREDVEREITDALTAAKAGLDADIAGVRGDVTTARGEITQVRTDLVPTITDAKKAGTDAAAEVVKVRTGLATAGTTAQGIRDDLTAEVSRAKGEEGSIRTTVASVKQTADKASTDISDEITTRANADSALGNRTSTVEAQLRGDQDSGLAAKVRDEATARADAVSAVGNRVSTTEAKLAGTQESGLLASIREEATARASVDQALSNKVGVVEAQMRGDQDSTLAARIRDEATARVNAVDAVAGRVSTTEAKLNGTQDSTIAANLRDEATARVNADSALSGRVSSTEAQMRGDQDSTLAARIRDEATTRADAVSAVGSRTSSLEATRDYTKSRLADNDLSEEGRKSYGMDAPGSPIVQYESNHGSVGWACHVRDANYIYFHNNRKIIKQVGRRIRASCWFWSSTVNARPRIYWNDNNGVEGRYRGEGESGGAIGLNGPVGVAGVWTKITSEITITEDWYLNIYAIFNADPWNGAPTVGGDFYVSGMIIEDVTEVAATNVRITDEQTVRANADSALGTRANTIEAQLRGDQDSTLAARIRDEATARADAVSAVAGRTSTLEASSRGGGNFLPNSDFAAITGWSITHNGMNMGGFVTQSGGYWNPRGGETCLTMSRAGQPGGGTFTEVQSQPFAVAGGSFIQFYALTSSHRSRAWTSIFYRDENGNDAGYAGENHAARFDNGGPDLCGWDQTGLKSTQVPGNARFAVFVWRIYETSGLSDPVGWMFHPYVGAARAGQTEWNAYASGPSNRLIADANARLTDETTARTNADSALSGRVSTTEAKLNGDQDSTIAARIRDEATARADAVSAVAGRTSTLETSAKGIGKTFLAVSRGSSTVAKFGRSGGIFNADGSQIAGLPRGWLVTVFDSNNTIIANNIYDTLAGDRGFSLGGAAEMAGFLNGITEGQTVVLTTNDEPASNRLTGGLIEAVERCGGGPLFSSPNFGYRGAYILIGQAGIGRGNGLESYSGTGDSAPDSWLERRFDLLNGRPLLNGAGRAVLDSNAKITDEATARSNADSALSGRVSTTEAKLNGDQDSTLAARIRDEATARTNNDGALATRASALEVSAVASSSTSLNQNPSMDYWTDPNGLPNGWVWWTAGGTVQRYATDNSSGGYAFRHNVPANVSAGIYQSAIRLQPGWYVMEADIELLDGSLQGTGVTVQGQYSMNFAAEADVNGDIGEGGFRRRRFTKLFRATIPVDNWHLMTNWAGFGNQAYCYVDWHYCGIRPATDGEILAQKVNNDVNGPSGAFAKISAEETARANGDSALAGRTSVVEAQVSNDSANMLRNGTFNAPGWVGRGAAGIPPYWGEWSNDNGAFRGASPRDSRYGAPAPFQCDRGGINNGIMQVVYNVAPGWYAFEVDITGEDGNWSGSGLHCNFNNGYAFNFGFATNADTADRTGDIGTANRQFTWLFYNGANTGQANLYLMSGWSGFQDGTNFGFFRGVWHRAVMRPATAGEIQARKVQDSNLIARVTSTESTVANINGKTQAYFSKTASVPGAEAFIMATALNDAGVATSNVAIGGSQIALYNTSDGSARRAMFLAGGNATFDGTITARTGVRIGDGTWSLAVSPRDFQVSNGQAVSYGTTLDRTPSITFGPCPVALNANEVYRAYAANATTTGFTAVCEIVGAPVSANQSVGPGYQVAGNQAYDVGKGTPDATNGQYTFNVYGSIVARAYYESGDCVHIDAFVGDGRLAGDVVQGDELLILTENRDGCELANVQRAYVSEANCLKITTVSGITLTLSATTPITLRDGREIIVGDVLGEEVAVLDAGAFRWEPVLNIEEIGLQPVARISVQSGTYAAGDQQGRMIFTHNINKN